MSVQDWYHGETLKNIGLGGSTRDFGIYRNGIHVSPQNREIINTYMNRAQRYQNVHGKHHEVDDLDNIGAGTGRWDLGKYKDGIHVSPKNRELIQTYQNRSSNYR
jgi:hypothetical protein